MTNIPLLLLLILQEIFREGGGLEISESQFNSEPYKEESFQEVKPKLRNENFTPFSNFLNRKIFTKENENEDHKEENESVLDGYRKISESPTCERERRKRTSPYKTLLMLEKSASLEPMDIEDDGLDTLKRSRRDYERFPEEIYDPSKEMFGDRDFILPDDVPWEAKSTLHGYSRFQNQTGGGFAKESKFEKYQMSPNAIIENPDSNRNNFAFSDRPEYHVDSSKSNEFVLEGFITWIPVVKEKVREVVENYTQHVPLHRTWNRTVWDYYTDFLPYKEKIYKAIVQTLVRKPTNPNFSAVQTSR